MTGWKAPEVNSSRCEEAADRRSSCLGVKAMRRLTRALVGLRAQHVEVVRRRGGLDDPHVVLGGQLQVTLDARARVVGSLTLIAVGEEHDERAALAPLLLGRADKLVDDRLRAVGEVSELGLPDRECLGALERVAVVEGQDAVLAQRGVPHVESRLTLGEERSGVNSRPSFASCRIA